jgi:hypothetical protein
MIRRASLALGLAAAVWILTPQPSSAATRTFSFTGTEQSYTVPAGVHSIHVLAVGAPGGVGSDNGGMITGGPAGFGDRLEADLAVTPGQVLFVEVGGRGADGGDAAGGGAGGFNGGGSSNDGGFLLPGGGGGGGTDIRTCSMLSTTCTAAPDTLSSRLLVAGGGAGGGALAFTALATDGQGGDAGKNGHAGGAGNGGTLPGGGGGMAGNQASGGAGGVAGGGDPPAGNPGGFGRGGAAGATGSNSEPGGGGGGGYFGGGAGGSANGGGGGGGGGGSSFAAAAATNFSTATDASRTAMLAITSVGGDFSLGKLKRNRHTGTAILTVDVPDPGTLRLSGKGHIRAVGTTVSKAGKVRLRIRAQGGGRRKLRRTGRLKLAATVTYTAIGAAPLSKARAIRLLKRP